MGSLISFLLVFSSRNLRLNIILFIVYTLAETWDVIADEMRKLAEQHPDLREHYLAKIKVQEARDLTSEEKLLAALKECDSIMGEIEEELAKKWNGKFGKSINRARFMVISIILSNRIDND